MIVIVDNYDSFTFNLQRYLVRLGQQVCVLRNDADDLQAGVSEAQAIVISPGPKAPSQAGRCLELIEAFSGRKPILGICLGHQAIYQAFGGRVVRAKQPMHGVEMPIQHDGSPLFARIPALASFARYHSLIADAEHTPLCLRVTARSESGEVMAIEHREHATFGVQFHPESILSHFGYQLLANFLTIAELSVPDDLPHLDLTTQPGSGFPSILPDVDECADKEAATHAVVLPRQPHANANLSREAERLTVEPERSGE